MKCAPGPSSTDRFLFLHGMVNSAMAFLDIASGIRRAEDDFVEVFLQTISTRHEHGCKILALRQHNALEQGLYFGDIMEMMCNEMNIEKTKDKAFCTLFNTDVPKLPKSTY